MWFAVSIFYRGKHQNPDAESELWEESIVLVEAENRFRAEELAPKAVREPFSYKTSDGNEVYWAFDSIERIYEIDAERLEHGMEIFSRFLRQEEVNSLKTPFEDSAD